MYQVAIDGPSGAGKSTIARAAAERYGFLYVDTGALYRTVGLAADRAGVAVGDAEGVRALLPGLEVSLGRDGAGTQREYLYGEDVTELIRTPRISLRASEVSALPEVRAFLLDTQRALASRYSVVMDGRDIGTVVLPEADVKIFLTADVHRRAERRQRELAAAGKDVSLDEVLRDMLERDRNDSSRAVAPLAVAAGAVTVDTSDMTLEESIAAVCGIIEDSIGVKPLG